MILEIKNFAAGNVKLLFCYNAGQSCRKLSVKYTSVQICWSLLDWPEKLPTNFLQISRKMHMWWEHTDLSWHCGAVSLIFFRRRSVAGKCTECLLMHTAAVVHPAMSAVCFFHKGSVAHSAWDNFIIIIFCTMSTEQTRDKDNDDCINMWVDQASLVPFFKQAKYN